MSLEPIDSNNVQTFDLAALIFEVAQFVRAKLRHHGCPDAEGCAFHLACNFILERLVNAGRCRIEDGRITLTIPGARNQKKVLFALVSYEVLAFKRTCKSCKYCHASDELNLSDSRQSSVPRQLIDPVTPEDLAASKELFAAFAHSFPTVERRTAFELRVLCDWPYREISRLLNVSSATVRMWVWRDKRRLRILLAGFSS